MGRITHPFEISHIITSRQVEFLSLILVSLSLWRCIIDRVKALIVAFLIRLCNTMGANVFQDGRGNFQRTLNSVPIIYLNREGLREQSVHLINNKFVNFLHKDPFFF